MSEQYRWIHHVKLWCNKCENWIDKKYQTYVMDNDVHCLQCSNWLCGYKDAFGDN